MLTVFFEDFPYLAARLHWLGEDWEPRALLHPSSDMKIVKRLQFFILPVVFHDALSVMLIYAIEVSPRET